MAVKKTDPEDMAPVPAEQAEAREPKEKRTTTKKSDGKAAGLCVYLGPSIRGVIQSGTVYRGGKAAVLKELAPALERHPLIASLVVTSDTLPVDRIKVKTAGNLLNVNYKSYAEEYEEFVTMKMKQSAQQRGARVADDFYSSLGVDRCASEEEIKRSFRVLIMQVHPDCSQWEWGKGVRSSDAMGEERAKELIEAYQTLRNPEKRTLYDLSLH